MARLQLLQLLALVLTCLVGLVSAGSAPVFCKCTCFKNSTIIPLGPKSQNSDSSPHSLRSILLVGPLFQSGHMDATEEISARPQNNAAPRSLSTSCSECTKSFCLSQGIDFCKEAKEDDVVSMCFQRDSNKDKIIVWGFILGTTGLLAWAAFKRVVEHRDQRAALLRQSISYAPVGNERQ